MDMNKMEMDKKTIIVAIIIFLLGIGGYFLYLEAEDQQIDRNEDTAENGDNISTTTDDIDEDTDEDDSVPSGNGQDTTGDDTSDSTDNVEFGAANVTDVRVIETRDNPPMYVAHIQGFHPNGCTSTGSITQNRTGDTFFVNIQSVTRTDVFCTQALVDFEVTVELQGSAGLGEGTYTVISNGAEAEFEVK